MQPGQRLGDYQLQQALGQGGMGHVWLATSPAGETVVIKCVLASGAVSARDAEQLRARLKREGKILLDLAHEGIVAARDAFEAGGEFFLVLDYVEGPTLEKWLLGDPPLLARLRVLRRILSAFEYAHARGVIHRDLKPLNVIVAQDERPAVLDFGLARGVDSTKLTRTGFAMGTIAYMAPEQARGQAVDHRADLFALGMLLARMLDLQAPFQPADQTARFRRLLGTEPVPLDPWLPDDLKQGLAALLAKDPQERTASAAEAGAFLDRLLGEGESLAARIAQARSDRSRRGTPSLTKVERREVGSILDDLLARTGSRRGGSLMLLAPSGFGRSSALASCADRLEQAGLPVESMSFLRGAPLELPREYLIRRGAIDSANEATIAPDMLAPAAEEKPSGSAGAPPDAEKTVRPFLDLLAEQARSGPLALLVDELQFAAELDREWLEGMLALTRDLPLVVVLAGDAAPETAGVTGASYEQLLARLSLLDTCQRVVLGPLDRDEVARALVSEHGLSAEDARQIAELSGGVPGVVNALLAARHSGTRLGPILDRGAPEYLTRLRRRWEQSDAGTRDTLKALVAAGGTMEVAALAQASGVPKLKMQSRLRDIARKHGWLEIDGAVARLLQPFFGALLGDEESGETLPGAPGRT